MSDIDETQWVATWTTTRDPVEKLALHGRTLGNIAYISLGGSQFRISETNA